MNKKKHAPNIKISLIKKNNNIRLIIRFPHTNKNKHSPNVMTSPYNKNKHLPNVMIPHTNKHSPNFGFLHTTKTGIYLMLLL